MFMILRPEPPNVTYHYHSHSIGENFVTWPPLTARRTGKCILIGQEGKGIDLAG